MATITVNQDNSLSLVLTAEERVTFDGLPAGQLAEFLTLWLEERFKGVWQERLNKLTLTQKQTLLSYLEKAIPKPEPVEPAPVEDVG